MTDPNPTMGAYLRAARRRRRISIERAAEDTRIRSDFLMRMESDEFDFLAPTYVRGFLKSYARYLRVDPDPLTAEFDSRFGGTRVESAHIVALERHGKRHLAQPRKKMSSWGVAAIGAAAVIVLLAVVGLIQGSGEEPPPRVASNDEQESPSPDVRQSPRQPSATPTQEPDVVAVDGTLELEIVASSADCWIFVTTDGIEATPAGGQTLALGDSIEFSAKKKMFVRLGFPAGVELIVNGRNVGSPGGQDPIDLRLPDDIDAF